MNLLACDTSTLLGSVAVVRDAGPSSMRQQFRQGSHSDALNGLIAGTLSDAQVALSSIDGFVTGVGPGSFTGIRISLNTIKTLGYSFNKPVFGVNTLLTLATQFQQNILRGALRLETQTDRLIVMLNAYKNMVYLAQYQICLATSSKPTPELAFPIELAPPQVVRVQQLERFLVPDSLIIGDGYLDYKTYIDTHFSKFVTRPQAPEAIFIDYPLASTLADISSKAFSRGEFFHWSKLVPMYLRASEAEENLLGIKYQPL
jgi:tRNA threonylcarbamoyladenosine biosynthesis protein TsaB